MQNIYEYNKQTMVNRKQSIEITSKDEKHKY